MRVAHAIMVSAACFCWLAACSPGAGPTPSSGGAAKTAPDVETPVVDLKGLEAEIGGLAFTTSPYPKDET